MRAHPPAAGSAGEARVSGGPGRTNGEYFAQREASYRLERCRAPHRMVNMERPPVLVIRIFAVRSRHAEAKGIDNRFQKIRAVVRNRQPTPIRRPDAEDGCGPCPTNCG